MRASGEDYTFLEAFLFFLRDKGNPSMRGDQWEIILGGNHFAEKGKKRWNKKWRENGNQSFALS
jgi:hypothetical protein